MNAFLLIVLILDQSVYLTLSQLWRLKTPVTSFWILNCQKNILLNENKFLCWPICSGCVLTCSTSSSESALGQTAATKVEIWHAVRTQLPPPLERMKFRCKQKKYRPPFLLILSLQKLLIDTALLLSKPHMSHLYLIKQTNISQVTIMLCNHVYIWLIIMAELYT